MGRIDLGLARQSIEDIMFSVDEQPHPFGRLRRCVILCLGRRSSTARFSRRIRNGHRSGVGDLEFELKEGGGIRISVSC
jgi:hypothetical protein